MATKTMNFHLPGQTNPISTTGEETILFSQVLTQLVHKEKLSANTDYIITDANGDEVKPSKSFGSARGNDFIISERTEAEENSAAATTHTGGFTGGDIAGPRSFHQLGILVLDGSASMSEATIRGMSKAEAVNDAVRGLLTRFKVSGKKENFSFSIVTFSNQAVKHTEITPADVINDNANYDPLKGLGGGTNIFEGLELARTIAKEFMQQYVPGGVPQSVAIVVLSDGMCFNPGKTKQVADTIKQEGHEIYSVYLNGSGQSPEAEAGKDLLKEIVSNRVIGFKEVWDAATLRDFFVASLSTPAANNT